MAAIPLAAAAQQPQRTPADLVQLPRPSSLADLKERVPQAELGNLKLSRMIFGGNLIGGWAHSRDLSYVGRLARAYHTPEKVFETLALAEQCGINTLLTSPLLIPLITDYWKKAGGAIQFISDCGRGELLDSVRQSIDSGAKACYVNGETADRMVQAGDFVRLSKALELIRSHHLPAGLGAHELNTLKACATQGLQPDFWMKTFHSVDYWSAPVEPRRDNNWCPNPGDVVDFMNTRKEPWIAFKVLAAGAIAPKAGFQHAFQNGADFICVGMFDWQVVDNCNSALAVLGGLPKRQRPWRA
jgi:hypothetical protein